MTKILNNVVMGYILKQYQIMFEDLIKKEDITQIEIDILAFLANHPEYQRAIDIVNVRGISKAHVSNAVDKLTKKGLLDRREDPDNRRCNVLYIRPEAQPLIHEIQQVQLAFYQLVYAGFSEEEKIQFNQLLGKIYRNLGGYHERKIRE